MANVLSIIEQCSCQKSLFHEVIPMVYSFKNQKLKFLNIFYTIFN